MRRGLFSGAWIAAALAAAGSDDPSQDARLVSSADGEIPALVSGYDRLRDASSWCATPGGGLVAAVLLPAAAAERPTSEIVLFSSFEDAPETLAIPGLVPDIALTPEGDMLFAIQLRPRARHDPMVRLVQIEVESLRARPSIALAVTARALAIWPEDHSLLVGGDDEVRSLRFPDLRSGRVYPIRGSTRALAVSGDGLLLVGQDHEILLVDPNRAAETEGLAPLERVPVASPVADLSAGTGDGPAFGRLLDGTWIELQRNPLRIQARGVAAGLIRVAREPESPRANANADAPVSRPIAAPPPAEPPREPSVPAPGGQASFIEPLEPIEPIETPQATAAPPPATSAQVWGRLAGSGRAGVEALALLGPNSIAREALRAIPGADGSWSASGLPPGRYRIVLVGSGGRTLSATPPFLTVEIVGGAASLQTPDFEIRGDR